MSNDPIYSLATSTQTILSREAAGVALHYGSDRFTEAPGAASCELRRFGQDTFGPAMTAGDYDGGDGFVYRDVASVAMGVKARFSGQSSKGGAGEHDHRGIVWDAVQATIGALYEASFSSGTGRINRMPVTVGSGEFIEPDPPPGSTEPATREIGARYELLLSVRAAVRRKVGMFANAPLGGVTVKAVGLDGTEETNCAPAP